MKFQPLIFNQLVSSVSGGGLSYKGVWNANTNTPTLADGTGTNGDYYLVSVAGTQNLGSGAIVFHIGDWCVYNGSIWQKIDNAIYAPTASKYLVQTADASLPNAQVMGSLATGLVKNNTTTGVQSIAADGTDYLSPLTGYKMLIPVATQTANYTANANEIVPCNISAGSFAVTLPTAPADGTRVRVQLLTVGANKVLEVKTGGSDKFFVASVGPTSIYMYIYGETQEFQYQASGAFWNGISMSPSQNFANNFTGIDAITPITNADISINPTTRVLSITPTLGFFNFYIDGGGKITKFRKTGTINFPAFTDTSGMWYFYFNSSGTAVTTQTAWTVNDFPSSVPVYRVLWNATLYNFTVTSANVVEGDTYTNNGQTFTVRQTYTGATTIKMTGTGNPLASGTLTRATGTGDATITFSAFDNATPRLVAQYVEYHLNTIDPDTHQWFHLQGAVWETGFTIAHNALTSGSPNADGRNTVVALTTGTNMDDNLDYTITNTATPTNPWEQNLGNTTPASLNATNSALFNVFRQRADGTISFRDETRFPFDWNTTTNIPNYITSTGVRTPVTNQRFMVNFIYSTQNPVLGNAIKVVSATQDFTTLANAQAYTWTNIQNTYSILGNDQEVRPLYRLIHEVHTSTPVTYDVGAKYSVLREVQDLRKAAVTSTTTASGSLPASSVTFVPAGNIGSTNVQSALEEVDSEKIAKTTNITALNDTGIADGEIAVFNLTNKDIRTSDKTIVTTLGSDDTTVPTSKAVKDVTDTKYGSGASPTFGTVTTTGGIELGNASDTTLARSSAGVISVEGAVIPTESSTNTLTNKLYQFTASPSTTTGSGVIVSLTYGESITVGDPLYFKSDGKVYKADANGSSTYPVMGLALTTASSGGNNVLLDGIYKDSTRWTGGTVLTVGGKVFLSTTAGAYTQTAPASTDDYIQCVGVALATDVILFRPSFDNGTHT